MADTATAPQPVYLRTVFSFLVAGFVLQIGVISASSLVEVIWVDFIHINPHRSQSSALGMIPSGALIAALALSGLSLCASTIIALAAQKLLGFIPFASIFIMLPICAYCVAVQQQFWFLPTEYDWETTWSVMIKNMASQLPVLLGCWWLNKRI